MKTFSTVVFILAGMVILSGIGYFGYQFYRKINAPAESPFKAIPPNTALIIKLNKPANFLKQTMENNQLWKDLFSISYLNTLRNKVSFLDSLIGKDPVLADGIKTNPLLIALSPTVPNEYGLLYMINFNEPDPDEVIQHFLTKSFGSGVSILKKSYGGSKIFHVRLKKPDAKFFFSNSKGIFMTSHDETLIKQAIDQLSLNLDDADDQIFEKIVARSGKNVDANLFINYSSIAGFIAGQTTHGKLADFLNVSGFAAWSGLDVIQKHDQWLISGYSICDDTVSQYLSLFSGQYPQQMTIQEVIPGDVSHITWIGLSDPERYLEKLAASKSETSIYLSGFSELMKFETRNRTLLRDYFLPWMGNEIGAVSLTNPMTLLPGEVYGIFRAADPKLADSLLRSFGTLLNGKQPGKTVKGYQIHNLYIPSVIPGVWGNLFQRLRGSSYFVLSDCVIFGNSQQSLEIYIDKLFSGDVIAKDPGFNSFLENVSAGSNLCFYYNISGSFEEFGTYLSEDIRKEIAPVTDTLKKFKSFSAQIINNENGHITNIFIPHAMNERASGGPLVWQTSLENPVAGRPQFVSSAREGTLGVLVYDNTNTLYLLDREGNISWKLKIPGKPLGDLCRISSGNSDSLRYVFNTDEQICIVDIHGLFVNNSPFRLPSKALNALTCHPAGKPAGEILVLQLADKRIHAFDLDGKEVKGWQKPSMKDPVVRPVQTLHVKGQELFAAVSKNGQVLIFDRTGRQSIKPAGNQLFSPASLFYQNKTNNKGDLLTSSLDGKLMYLRTDGKTSEVKFNNFTPGHVFFYADINKDKIQEFIYYDLNKIYCYNRFQKLLFDHTFHSPVLEPVMATCPTGEFILGTVSPKTGEVFLFGKKGLVGLDPAVSGNTAFDLAKEDSSKGTNLVIGSGKMVKNFLLPQE